MKCRYCGAWNAEDEHRCERCGRRLQAGAPRTLAYPLPNSSAVPAAPPDCDATVELPAPERQPVRPIPRQASLFGGADRPKVIPFDSIAGIRPSHRAPVEAPPVRKPSAPKPAPRPAAKSAPATATGQQNFDFRPHAPRANPLICSDAPEVAPLGVRCAAMATDGLLMLSGLALFFLTFYVMGGEIVLARKAVLGYLIVAALLSLFYRVFWCILKRDTVGMRYFHVRLVNFDGHQPEGRQRAIRLMSACLGAMAAGLGLLWALFDEENLTWHDHISKTFPAVEK